MNNGRGIIAALLLIVVSLIVCAAIGRANVPDAELYPRTGIVTGIDRDADVVTWTDGAGLDWSFYGCEDWMIGDHVAAIMDDNGTATVYDDVIVTARYAG